MNSFKLTPQQQQIIGSMSTNAQQAVGRAMRQSGKTTLTAGIFMTQLYQKQREKRYILYVINFAYINNEFIGDYVLSDIDIIREAQNFYNKSKEVQDLFKNLKKVRFGLRMAHSSNDYVEDFDMGFDPHKLSLGFEELMLIGEIK